jgi:UDP-glucose 4-epimerase
MHILRVPSGASVLEVVKAFEEASGQQVSYEIVDRRSGEETDQRYVCM